MASDIISIQPKDEKETVKRVDLRQRTETESMQLNPASADHLSVCRCPGYSILALGSGSALRPPGISNELLDRREQRLRPSTPYRPRRRFHSLS